MVNYIQISSYSGLQLRRWIIVWYDITYVIISAILKTAAAKQIMDPIRHLGKQICLDATDLSSILSQWAVAPITGFTFLNGPMDQ